MNVGNCYAASEALYHILGGKRAGWKPMYMNTDYDGQQKGRLRYGHWFLQHKSGMILDPSVRQFRRKPDYSKAKGHGFLTKHASKRAKQIIEVLTWRQA